ncbi:MAG: OmpW family protein [Bacteroidetes bacterium]|nr:OmpW family protein [Bacteroidota bacterium]
MKKTIFIALFACFAIFNTVNAQETETNNAEFSKWQARFRLISVIPSVGDDIDGADVDISTAFVPELDFTYFFTENWAAELILATTKHDVDVNLGTGIDLGHVWLLPPTLNLQYHFTGGKLKPYLGAGINYTIFYGIDEGDVVGMDYDNSVGFSLQGGLDYDLNGKWFLNLDIKKLILKTDVSVDTGEGVLPVEVDIDPLVIGFGVGMKF